MSQAWFIKSALRRRLTEYVATDDTSRKPNRFYAIDEVDALAAERRRPRASGMRAPTNKLPPLPRWEIRRQR